MSTMIKDPDELWTSYLIRRLEAEGMRFAPYTVNTNYVNAEPVAIFFTNSLINEKSDIQISKQILVPLSISQCRSYGRIRAEIGLMETANILLPERDQASISFYFNPQDRVRFENHEQVELGKYFKQQYRERERYNELPVIEDIVSYALKLKPASGFPSLPPPDHDNVGGSETSPRRPRRGLFLLPGNQDDSQ